MFSKGPNYRENKTVNYNACLKEISSALDICASNMASKYQLDAKMFDNWKGLVKQKVNEKYAIKNLKKTTTNKSLF